MKNFGGHIPIIDEDVVLKALEFVCEANRESVKFMRERIDQNKPIFKLIASMFLTMNNSHDREVLKMMLAVIFKSFDMQLERNFNELQELK